MLQEVYEALEARDLVLVLVDATRRVQLEAAGSPPMIPVRVKPRVRACPELAEGSESGPGNRPNPHKHNRTEAWASEDEFLFGLVRKLDCPVFLVLTKIDLVAQGRIACRSSIRSPRQFNFAEIIPVSARKRDGLDILLRKIVDALPTGERYYPKDQYTDQPLRFMVAELIRESILVETGEEVPYAAAVVIERLKRPNPPRRLARKARPRPGCRSPASPPPSTASAMARRQS